MARKKNMFVEMSGEGILGYKQAHYLNLGRGQLSRINKPLYTEFNKRGLLTTIPKLVLTKKDILSTSNNELLNYVKNKYSPLDKKILKRKNRFLFRELKKRELIEILWSRQRREKRLWKDMNNQMVIDYTKKNYPHIKNLRDLEGIDDGLHSEVCKRKLQYEIYRTKKPLPLLTKEEALKKYLEGYKGYNRSELFKKDQESRRVYNALRKFNLLDIVPTKRPQSIKWRRKSDEEILKEYKTKYGNLNRGELHKKNKGLYGAMYKRDLLKYTPESKRKINNNQQKINSLEKFQEFVKNNETAKRLIALGLSGNNGTLSDVVSSIVKSNPDEFDETTSFKIPRWISEGTESLMPYIGPFVFHNYGDVSDFLKYVYQNTKDKEIIVNVQNLASDVLRNMCMKEFNNNPARTLKNLENSLEQEKDSSVKGLLQKTYDYYSEISSYKIPGIKSIEERK